MAHHKLLLVCQLAAIVICSASNEDIILPKTHFESSINDNFDKIEENNSNPSIYNDESVEARPMTSNVENSISHELHRELDALPNDAKDTVLYSSIRYKRDLNFNTSNMQKNRLRSRCMCIRYPCPCYPGRRKRYTSKILEPPHYRPAEYALGSISALTDGRHKRELNFLPSSQQKSVQKDRRMQLCVCIRSPCPCNLKRRTREAFVHLPRPYPKPVGVAIPTTPPFIPRYKRDLPEDGDLSNHIQHEQRNIRSNDYVSENKLNEDIALVSNSRKPFNIPRKNIYCRCYGPRCNCNRDFPRKTSGTNPSLQQERYPIMHPRGSRNRREALESIGQKYKNGLNNIKFPPVCVCVRNPCPCRSIFHMRAKRESKSTFMPQRNLNGLILLNEAVRRHQFPEKRPKKSPKRV